MEKTPNIDNTFSQGSKLEHLGFKCFRAGKVQMNDTEVRRVIRPAGEMLGKVICVVTAGDPCPWIIINSLADHFGPLNVILEKPESKWLFLRRRSKIVGIVSTFGQFATMVMVVLGKRVISKRIAFLVSRSGLDVSERAEHNILPLNSVNEADFLKAIGTLKPDVVLLAGCRILTQSTLVAIACPVLNYHAGINPKYRGVNGAYWALASGDAENFGSTVHLVDQGVDTGEIFYQTRAEPQPGDSLMTYSYRLAAVSREICVKSVEDALKGNLRPVKSDLPSKQWFHPTIWSYLWIGITRGVW